MVVEANVNEYGDVGVLRVVVVVLTKFWKYVTLSCEYSINVFNEVFVDEANKHSVNTDESAPCAPPTPVSNGSVVVPFPKVRNIGEDEAVEKGVRVVPELCIKNEGFALTV